MENQFDDLVLDDNALEEIATFLVLYCNQQQVTINEYMQKMNSLSSDWQDDETIGKVLQEVRILNNNLEKIMSIIRYKYPQYFRKKAQEIRNRNNIHLY